MANLTIAQLTQILAAGVDNADLLPLWDDTAQETKKITIAQFKTLIGAVESVGATSPIASSGGKTPTISISQSGAATDGYLSSADWNTFNGKQGAITLTTTGSSGAATFVGNTLNIPNYSFSLVNWSEGFSSATQETSQWTPLNAAANVNAALVPKGTGAIVANVPNGAASGGNARGQYAVDFLMFRNNANQVASGSYSFLGSGAYNRADGSQSAVVGGQANATTIAFSFIGGGINNLNQGQSSVIGGGGTNTITGPTSAIVGGGDSTISSQNGFIGGGDTNTVSASYGTIGGGSQNTASATYSSILGGLQGSAYLYGQQAYASGRFSANGDAQSHELIWRRLVTGTAQTELFLDGASVAAILPATNTIWQGTIEIAAICTVVGNGTTTLGDAQGTSYKVTIKRLGATTALVGTVQEIGTTNADPSALGVFTIDANDTNESLRIQFTPPPSAGSTTVHRVVATFRGLQIRY